MECKKGSSTDKRKLKRYVYVKALKLLCAWHEINMVAQEGPFHSANLRVDISNLICISFLRMHSATCMQVRTQQLCDYGWDTTRSIANERPGELQGHGAESQGNVFHHTWCVCSYRFITNHNFKIMLTSPISKLIF